MIYSKSVVNESWGKFLTGASVSILFLFSIAAESQVRESRPVFTMAAVGDSVTAGVNSTGWGSQLQDSWSTGSSPDGTVESHYLKLKKIIDGPIKVINVARGGATSKTVGRQLDELRDMDLDYVTFFIGSNDICKFSDDYSQQLAKFRVNVYSAIERLIRGSKSVKILLLPVPDLYALWEIGRQNSCQWLWNMTGLCSSLLHASRTQDQRETFKQKVIETNRVLSSMQKEFPEHVRIDPTLGSKKFGISDLSSLDCFHPSGKGQNLISQSSWQNGWFTQGS